MDAEQKNAIIREYIDDTVKMLKREKRREYNHTYRAKHKEQLKKRATERMTEKAIELIKKQAQERTGLFAVDNIFEQDFDRFLEGVEENNG